jgi:uridine kinase
MCMLCGAAAVDRALLLARDASAPLGMARVVLAIDGRSGAGKSTLAARVASRLGDAAVVHTDDFASWDNPLDWWPRLLEQVLHPLSEGLPARYQRYDWDLQQLAEWHELQPGGYLVIEGVSASRSEFRPYLAATVWVSATRDECLRRGLERDGHEALDQWLQWQAAEDEYIARDQPDRVADLIVSGEGGEPWPGPNRPDKAPAPESGQ